MPHPKNTRPTTLGELRKSDFTEERCRHRSVREEIRENLIRKMEKGETLFPGILGYEETVIPALTTALLSQHHMILLGLRGQAKSRLLRNLVDLLDEALPAVAGCEIHDNPYAPLCAACRSRIAEEGDRTPLTWLSREERYVEKLATPDVTIADILGDVDPIRAARTGRDLSDTLTIHYGLLPRAHRGIFAINELPDLAPKIQVGLFTIMEEGDIQIKGYPIRLPLDVLLVFSANPEDYTARGKIITPLKDRIGSEIATHYPATPATGVAITAQEAWLRRSPDSRLQIPAFIPEVVEQIAFQARESKWIDKRSGVSQRMPITCLESVVSSAERRALLAKEKVIVPRPADIYAALPALTGKLELEYEGEMKGREVVATALIIEAFGKVYGRYSKGKDPAEVISWFSAGGEVKISALSRTTEALATLSKIPSLMDATVLLGLRDDAPPGLLVSACEFILEGLYAHRKISRTPERGFFGAEVKAPPASPEPPPAPRRRYDN